jgi:NAD-dependent SIR2 family protein deacetylase
MGVMEWACNHCGVDLGDDAVRPSADKRDPVYCYNCAEIIANAFLDVRDVPREFQSRDDEVEILGPKNVWKQREAAERLDALEEQVRRVSSVWRLWLNDAEKGCINQTTFDAMKNLLGMQGS